MIRNFLEKMFLLWSELKLKKTLNITWIVNIEIILHHYKRVFMFRLCVQEISFCRIFWESVLFPNFKMAYNSFLWTSVEMLLLNMKKLATR